MEVFIVEWCRPAESETHVTCFDTMSIAQQAACADIIDDISSNWDLTEEDQNDVARDINGDIANGNFGSAISKFNDYNSDQDYEYQQFYYVQRKALLNTAPTPSLIEFDDLVEEDEEDEEDEEEEDETYTACTPGATCRGPCGSHSPDAYADQRDGTFVCYQCRLMTKMFGGTIT